MFFNNGKSVPGHGSSKSTVVFLAAALLINSCGTLERDKSLSSVDYTDGVVDRYALALRFAPDLFLHAGEPYEITAIIPVFNPARPIVAFHIFFEHDAVLLGGKAADHEIVWVQFDPITLKIDDVTTLWHRTVLRTDECLIDARASGQHPKISVQWGQHGMLPFGWKSLDSARPRLELVVHYNIVHNLNRLPKIGSRGATVSFEGSYDDYVHFTTLVRASNYIKRQDVIVAEYSERELISHLPAGFEFKVKKEWPDW